MRRILYIIITLGCISLSACNWGFPTEEENEHDIDIKVGRFDKLLNEYVTLNSFAALQKMTTEYPKETKLLLEDVLTLGVVDDNHINTRLRSYYSDTLIIQLMSDALEKFADMKDIELQLTKGFRHLKKEVPQLTVPRVYAQISALNQSVVVGDSLLGFSIDKYMGTDYPLYKRFYYDFQLRSMEPSRIVPDCFVYYLLREYPLPRSWHSTLLDRIMHNGKMHWVITRILGYDSPEDELGYTIQEKAWCKEHRDQIWEYVVQSYQLDSTDPYILRMYLGSVPGSSRFGEDSPAMLGVWLGAQLVDAYMKKNKEVTIAQLLEDTDYCKMLSDIQYKL